MVGFEIETDGTDLFRRVLRDQRRVPEHIREVLAIVTSRQFMVLQQYVTMLSRRTISVKSPKWYDSYSPDFRGGKAVHGLATVCHDAKQENHLGEITEMV